MNKMKQSVIKHFKDRDSLCIYFSNDGKILKRSTGITSMKGNETKLYEEKKKVDDAIMKCFQETSTYDVTIIKEILDDTYQPQIKVKTLISALLEYQKFQELRVEAKEITKGSTTDLNNLITAVKEFGDTSLKRVNETYLRKLKIHMNEVRKLNHNSIKKRFKILRVVWKWLVIKNVVEPNLELYNYRISSYDPSFLYFDEKKLEKLRTTEVLDLYQTTKDILLILCYTGMRYSDYYTLQPEHIQDGVIIKYSKKTKVLFKVPIHPYIKHLFDKPLVQWEGHYFNREVKKLCRALKFKDKVKMKTDIDTYEEGEFWTFVSSHIGRHTMATSILLNKVPINVGLQWMGWTKPDMLFYYADRLNIETENYITQLY